MNMLMNFLFDWLIRNRYTWNKQENSVKSFWNFPHRLLVFHALQSNPFRVLWLYAKRKKFSVKKLHNVLKRCHVRWPAFLIYEPSKLLKKSSKPRYIDAPYVSHIRTLIVCGRTNFVFLYLLLAPANFLASFVMSIFWFWFWFSLVDFISKYIRTQQGLLYCLIRTFDQFVQSILENLIA